MNRDTALMLGVGAMVVVVLIAVGLGGFGTTSTTSESASFTSFPDPPSDGSAGVVFDLHEREGQSFFGISFSGSRFTAHIGMVAPEECVQSGDGGQDMLLDTGECSGLPAHGAITGSGVTITGDNLVIVSVEVSRACFDSLGIGDEWPAANEGCQE